MENNETFKLKEICKYLRILIYKWSKRRSQENLWLASILDKKRAANKKTYKEQKIRKSSHLSFPFTLSSLSLL